MRRNPRTVFRGFPMRIGMRITLDVPLLMTKTLSLPLTTAKTKPKNSSATNLWLREKVKKDAKVIARIRYGYSLSEMVDKLLELECAGKKGILEMAERYRRDKDRLFRLPK